MSIATRLVFAKDSSGRKFSIALGIGQPYEVSPGEWACPVAMGGLHDQLRDQRGIDSWQSLQLAYQLIGQLLAGFIEDGGSLSWPDDGEPIAIGDFTPRLRGNA